MRQRRSDETTANAVARGLNILAVRDAPQAQRYMEYKYVWRDKKVRHKIRKLVTY